MLRITFPYILFISLVATAGGILESFRRTLEQGLRLTVVIGVPAAAGMMALAGPILATLFGPSGFGNI